MVNLILARIMEIHLNFKVICFLILFYEHGIIQEENAFLHT